MIPRRKFFKRLAIAAGIGTGLYLAGTLALVGDGVRDRPGKADVGLVLGSKVERDGTPSARLRARLDTAVECYRASRFPAVIVSGGFGKEGFDEALVMRDYLVAQGIPAECVIVDSEGTTTYASARTMRRIARERKFKSICVVSQYFHIPRARLALHRFGFASVSSAYARFFEPRDVYSSLRELPGYVKYLVRRYDAPAD